MERMTRKKWMSLIDEWMTEKGLPTQTWEQVVTLEGGYGKDFIRSVEDALTKPDTHPGRWFASKQEDTDLYFAPEYVYSLLFGSQMISAQFYNSASTIFADHHRDEVVDVGGSIFTAARLVKNGFRHVLLTNFGDSPQLEFAEWCIKKLDAPIEVIDDHEIPFYSTLFVSEYFEHFRHPVQELDRLLAFSPRVVMASSSFAMPAYGHYIPITIGTVSTSSTREANRLFRLALRERGSLATHRVFNGFFESLYPRVNIPPHTNRQ